VSRLLWQKSNVTAGAGVMLRLEDDNSYSFATSKVVVVGSKTRVMCFIHCSSSVHIVTVFVSVINCWVLAMRLLY
jgi:hypothetical protein